MQTNKHSFFECQLNVFYTRVGISGVIIDAELMVCTNIWN